MTRSRHSLAGRSDIRRILVIKWTAMGDVVLASAIIEDLHRAFPDATIDLNTMEPWDRLFRDDPRIQRIFTVDLRGRERGWRGIRRWLREVRRGRYDLVVDLQSNDRSALLLSALLLSGGRIPYRIGHRKRLPYNIFAPAPEGPRYSLEWSRAALRAAGIPAETPLPVLHVPTQNREHAQALMIEEGLVTGQFALFMPGCQAAGHLKRWGAERYAELARLIQAEGVKAALIGGPDEREECARIRALAGDAVVDLCGRTEVLDILPLAEASRYIVSNDTGTAHLSAAADRPMVVICGPTDPRRVRPPGDKVTALQATLPCINCYGKQCSHHSCMPMVTPRAVLAVLHGRAPDSADVALFGARPERPLATPHSAMDP